MTQQTLISGKEMGKCCAENGITTGQLRKFLSHVIQITNFMQTDEKLDLVAETDYLKMKLAYQVGRTKNEKNKYPIKKEMFEKFFNQVEMRINDLQKAEKTKQKEEYKKFHRYVEEVVAYHKYYGGND